MSLQADLFREMAWRLEGRVDALGQRVGQQWQEFHRQNPNVPDVRLHTRRDEVIPIVNGRARVDGVIVACLPAHVRERAHAIHAAGRRSAVVGAALQERAYELRGRAMRMDRDERQARRRTKDEG